MTHTLQARQRNDADLAANERKIETLSAKRDAIDRELADLQTTRRALMAMAISLRDEGGQL